MRIWLPCVFVRKFIPDAFIAHNTDPKFHAPLVPFEIGLAVGGVIAAIFGLSFWIGTSIGAASRIVSAIRNAVVVGTWSSSHRIIWRPVTLLNSAKFGSIRAYGVGLDDRVSYYCGILTRSFSQPEICQAKEPVDAVVELPGRRLGNYCKVSIKRLFAR